MVDVPDATVPVLVVGAGPTGVAVAGLLAQYGVRSRLVDRFPEAYPQPRAVHVDDEVYRILARLGIADGFARISRPMRGLRLVDAAGGLLAEFPRPPELARHGYPQANMFDQPELEDLLRENLGGRPEVELSLGTEVLGIDPAGGRVQVDVLDPSGRWNRIDAGYVLGCDGANSLVRREIGAQQQDLGFEQRWLVVDVETDVELGTWEGVHQVCDGRRPATFMRVGRRRYRWEFRLGEAESAADFAELAALLPLLRPWVADVAVDALHLVRVTEYTFRAAVTDRWRQGRVLLLGDAAHLTPPFTGQGLGAGLRDAHNLAWKLAGVVHGRFPDTVLDSYQAEREPHVRSLIRLAMIVGWAMSAGGRVGDVLRRALVPRLHVVPGLRARAADSATPPVGRSALVRRSRLPFGLAGSLCPNVPLPTGERFDDASDGGFVLVSVQQLTEAQVAGAAGHGVRVLQTEPGDPLGVWLARHRARAALVRPDFVVQAAARRPEPLLTVLRAMGSGAPASSKRVESNRVAPDQVPPD